MKNIVFCSIKVSEYILLEGPFWSLTWLSTGAAAFSFGLLLIFSLLGLKSSVNYVDGVRAIQLHQELAQLGDGTVTCLGGGRGGGDRGGRRRATLRSSLAERVTRETGDDIQY